MSTFAPVDAIWVSEKVWDIETGRVLEENGEWWRGSIVMAKKGRGEMEQVSKQSLADAATNRQRQSDTYGKLSPDIDQLRSSGAPGGLSHASQARLAQDLTNIGNTYGNMRRVGLRDLAQRGFTFAPTGYMSSLVNTANMGEGEAETNAYEKAQQMTREDELAALNAEQGLYSATDPNRSLSTASDSAYRRSQMGSTLGDVGGGIATGVGLATGIKGLSGVGKGK